MTTLGDRIAVVGSGGAGKSTLARALGRRTGLPVVHLDAWYWRPGWVETPAGEWSAVQHRLVAEPRWILDGNYGGTLDIRLARATTVVDLALPPVVCLRSVLWRGVRQRGREVQAPGCPERIDRTFLRWVWRYPRDSRPRLEAALARYPGVPVVRLRSRRAVRRFLDALRDDASPGMPGGG